jgi:hypothetical protein
VVVQHAQHQRSHGDGDEGADDQRRLFAVAASALWSGRLFNA